MEFGTSQALVALGFAVLFVVLTAVLIHDNRPGRRSAEQVHRNAANMIATFRRQGLMKRLSLHDELD